MTTAVAKTTDFAVKTLSSAVVEQESQRAIAEVQAAMIIAKKFPRDIQNAIDRIMLACQRPALAESAIYTYAKGGSDITGPSIRLAEAMAQAWGNMQFGIREIEQRNGESTVEAFAWDIETNTRQVKVFQVKHIRHTRKGSYTLEDPREIYEMTANQGARRLRACILGIIPGDIVEQAVDECEKTMTAKADNSPEAIKKLLTAFTALGVEKGQIEKRIQRRIESITPAQIVGMRKIYNSLKDGMSTASDWFDDASTAAALTERIQTSVKQQLPSEKDESPSDVSPIVEMVKCPNTDGEERTKEYCDTKCTKREGCPEHASAV